MPTLWIVHREPAARRTLARLAGARADVFAGGPDGRNFEAAPEPDVILLGPAGDFEAELEFAHRHAQRRPGASWILLPETGAGDDARQLFDALPAEILPFPPDPSLLRRRIRAAAAGRRRHDSLSQRRVRDALADRFRRWFSDLELPELLRAVDPHLATVPVLVRGEPGTGRTVIAQYIHVFGGSTGGTFVHLPCREIEGAAAAVLELIRSASRGGEALTICLEDVDALTPVAQRQLRVWIENGLPPETVRTERVRWIATAGEEDPWTASDLLDPALEDALAGIVIRIPPLRERMEALDAMVLSAATSWCERHGQRARSFTPDALAALRDVLWLGNVREVEAVVSRTLASHNDDPIRPADLVLGEPEPRLEAVVEAGDLRPAREPHSHEAGIREAEIVEEPAAFEAGERFVDLEAEVDASGEAPVPAAPGAETAPEAHLALVPDAEAAAAPETSDTPFSVFAAETEAAAPESSAALEASVARERANAKAGAERSAASLRQLVGSIAHEIRNPLVAVRTFAQLLPERFDDPDFRRRAVDIVGADVRRIEAVVERLSRLAELSSPEPKPVNVVEIVENALAAERGTIGRRRLVVLTELDRENPFALGDEEQLRFAFESLLTKALELVPDRGDLYFASKHHADALDGAPALRLLVRFRSPGELGATGSVPGVSLDENSLEMTVTRSIVEGHGGRMTVGNDDGRETVVVIDLPAPA